MPLFRYQQDSINEAYAKRDKLREAGLTAFLVQKRRTGDLFLCVRADNEQAISDALAKRNPPDSSMPPSHYEELASRAIKRRKWSEAARHYRDAAAVTVGHNQAARYIEAAERMERRVDGQPAPRSEVVRGNPPRRREKFTRKPVAGYINRLRTGEVMTDFDGKATPWVLSEVVDEYRDEHGDRSAAVILTHSRRKGVHAVGYLLVSGGTLFRGEMSDTLDRHDLRMEARAEAWSWHDKDSESEASDLDAMPDDL
jgi:hypothetical protein